MLAAALLILVQSSAALAASPAIASIVVHIVDSAGKPIWLAQATLFGTTTLVGTSLRDGSITFSKVRVGNYNLRVARYGYQTVDVHGLLLNADREVDVVVRLSGTTLKQITHVSVSAKTSVNPTQISSQSVSAQLSGSTSSALAAVPGLTIDPSGGTSLNGYPPADTTFAINGVPVSLPGTPQNIQIFNADVFDSASVSSSAQGGGIVNFRTASPTLAWQGTLRTILSSHQGEDIAVQELGTAGNVGLSLTHAHRITPNALEGLSYSDSSGKYYPHKASDLVDGDALQLRYQFSQDNTVLASAIDLHSRFPFVCYEWTGKLPCGYGPTNYQDAHLTSYQLRDAGQLGGSTFDVTAYTNHTDNVINQSGYYVNGVNIPTQSESVSNQLGIVASLDARFGDVSVPFSFTSSTTSTDSTGSAFGQLVPAVIARYSSQSLTGSIPILSRGRVEAHAAFVIRSNAIAQARQTRTTAAINVSYVPSHNDSISASFSPGNLGTPIAPSAVFSQPDLLHFICSSQVAVGNGPVEVNTEALQTHATLQWHHNADRWSSEIDAYRNVQLDAPVSALVSASAVPAGLLPPDYLTRAQQQSVNVCGESRLPSLSSIFFQVTGRANRAIYDGINASFLYTLAQRLGIGAHYAVTSARAYGLSSLLSQSESTVTAGRQLPNVPLHTAGLDLKLQFGPRVVGLLQANYTSANNSYNLPSFVTVDAGALVTLSRGIVSVTVQNIFNAFHGPFATTNQAVPLPMGQGAVATVAQPLMPFTLNVGYRFHVGPPEAAPSFSLPDQQFQPLGSGLTYELAGVPLPMSPPVNPFSIDSSRVECGAKDALSAQQALKTWAQYVERIEQSKRGVTYPNAFPPLRDGAVQLNYMPSGASYVVFASRAPNETLLDFERQLAPVQNCARIHQGSEQEMRQRRLFELPAFANDDSDSIAGLFPLYSPEVGLYHGPYRYKGGASSGLPRPENIGEGRWPSRPPNQPLALKSWAGCPPEIAPAAQQLLAEIKNYADAYFNGRQPSAPPKGIRITAHGDHSSKWISIRAEDLQSMNLLVNQCMYVSLLTQKRADKMGIGGDRQVLNYAPGIGLYEIL